MKRVTPKLIAIFLVLWRPAVVTTSVIGVAGVPEDAETWASWISEFSRQLSTTDIIIITLGAGILAGATGWDWAGRTWSVRVVPWWQGRKFKPLQIDWPGLVAGSKSGGQLAYAAKFWLAGQNTGHRSLEIQDAEIRSLLTGQHLPLQIRTDTGYAPLSEANPIPPDAPFYLQALLYDSSSSHEVEGMREDEFLKTWGKVEVSIKFDGIWRSRIVGHHEIYQSFLGRLHSSKSTPHPKVTRKTSTP